MRAEETGSALVYCRVRGRVQGVGFRFFIREQAQRLHLGGFVRNCPDGSVEIQAQGPPEALQSLVLSARSGPPGARVNGCEVTWGKTSGDVERPDSLKSRSFQIR